MINLLQYREYWERVAARLDSVTGVLPVAVDKDMGKKIQALPTGSVTLFILPPGGESDSKNPDAFREANQCVVFVMEKYDPQRKTAFAALESSQKAIEEIKTLMLDDLAAGCPVMRFDVSTLNTLPETEFFAGFAGWSIGFKIIT
ncbi:MAG: hypothetical protein OSJ46_06230 [Duncaniella sp.]|nr:hypothetical protein [Duncaniella sp.]